MKNIFLINSFLGLWLLSIFNANGIAIINITKNKQIIEFSIFDLDGKLIECGFGYDVVSVNNIFKS